MCEFVFFNSLQVAETPSSQKINKYRGFDLSVLNGSYDPGSGGFTLHYIPVE